MKTEGYATLGLAVVLLLLYWVFNGTAEEVSTKFVAAFQSEETLQGQGMLENGQLMLYGADRPAKPWGIMFANMLVQGFSFIGASVAAYVSGLVNILVTAFKWIVSAFGAGDFIPGYDDGEDDPEAKKVAGRYATYRDFSKLHALAMANKGKTERLASIDEVRGEVLRDLAARVLTLESVARKLTERVLQFESEAVEPPLKEVDIDPPLPLEPQEPAAEETKPEPEEVPLDFNELD